MDLELRTTEQSDYDAIATWIEDATSCSRWAGPLVPFPFSARELPELLSVKGGSSYSLYDSNNNCIGFGQFWVVKQGAVHLGRIIISPEARGFGAGRLLCNKLMAKAMQEAGAARVTLRVYRDNAPALSLYSSLGFSIIESESTDNLLLMSASNAE
ncbi:MAG: GNAT family N-acetyltransferase [Saccharospirillum sp.]|uniref:GNAT family N-acetyltransferase n=1 Tax=Saccharospirillum sp. TaxID=2033801 RepID=UPI0032984CEE